MAEATVEAAVTKAVVPGLVGIFLPKTRIERIGVST